MTEHPELLDLSRYNSSFGAVSSVSLSARTDVADAPANFHQIVYGLAHRGGICEIVSAAPLFPRQRLLLWTYAYGVEP